jgi:hypothetical protein
MIAAGLVVLLSAGLAAFTYLRLERLGPRAWLPLVSRAIVWSALGLLLLNVGCPIAGRQEPPLVLLDGSLSMDAPGGRWAEALDSARRAGEIRWFGDEDASTDSLPTLGRSLLRPALTAAAASSRPVVVVTDGDVEDAADIPLELLAQAPAPDIHADREKWPFRPFGRQFPVGGDRSGGQAEKGCGRLICGRIKLLCGTVQSIRKSLQRF